MTPWQVWFNPMATLKSLHFFIGILFSMADSQIWKYPFWQILLFFCLAINLPASLLHLLQVLAIRKYYFICISKLSTNDIFCTLLVCHDDWQVTYDISSLLSVFIAVVRCAQDLDKFPIASPNTAHIHTLVRTHFVIQLKRWRLWPLCSSSNGKLTDLIFSLFLFVKI